MLVAGMLVAHFKIPLELLHPSLPHLLGQQLRDVRKLVSIFFLVLVSVTSIHQFGTFNASLEAVLVFHNHHIAFHTKDRRRAHVVQKFDEVSDLEITHGPLSG